MAYVCWSSIGDEFLQGASTSFLDVVFHQYDGVEVGVEQRPVAATVARDADELGTDPAEVDVLTELHRSTVGEAVVGRRTAVVVSAAVSWRRRPVDCLVLAVVQLVVVV